MKKIMSVMISTGLLFLLSTAMRAATVSESWNGGTGNWDTIGDWTPATVPNNGGGNVYAVTIDSGGADSVALDISPTIASLVLGGSTGSSLLQNTSGTAETLTITGALTINTTGTLVFSNVLGGTYASTLNVGASSTNSGLLDLEIGSTLSITGNLTNSGTVETNRFNHVTVANHLTVTGAFTNNAGAGFNVGNNNNTADVASVGSLVNNGSTFIGVGATLNLTSQPSGITDVVSGSLLDIMGTFKAGANSGLNALNSIEGELRVRNAQSQTATPGSGTLTVSSSGILDVEGFPSNGTGATSLTISGNLTNSGTVETNRYNGTNGNNNTTNSSTVTVTGTFTNNTGATLLIGNNNNTKDVFNIGTLVNNGVSFIGVGATLNLTGQPSGITDVVSGSRLDIGGTFKAGANSGLHALNSVEGELDLRNAQSQTATPGSGTLTVSSSGILDVEGFNSSGTGATSLTISGNLTNSGTVETNRNNGTNGNNNTTNSSTVTVTGTFTNNSGATLLIGNNGDTKDVFNIATLVNNGGTFIGVGTTLNLTSQPSGITDVVSGSRLDIGGTFKAGANSGLHALNSIEGELDVRNAQSQTATPGSGTLTVSSSGILDVEGFNSSGTGATSLTISGNLTNSGLVETNRNAGTNGTNNTTNSSTVTVTGTFTNNSFATVILGNDNVTKDVLNIGTLVNNGSFFTEIGTTLNLTSQPSGITDVVSGSRLDIGGGFTAGAKSGLNALNSIEGELDVRNAQSQTATPGSGTLTVSSSGLLDVEGFNSTGTGATTLTISGNLTNSGTVETNRFGDTNGSNNTTNSSTFTVTGTFTNNASGQFVVGNVNNTHDVANVGSLSNSGSVYIGTGATLNLTSQPSGITDVVSGSTLDVAGTFKAGANSALANLNSIEGTFVVENAQSTTATPGSGTLTVSSSGILDVEGFSGATTLTISGNLTNSGFVETNRFNHGGAANLSTLTLTGTFTNNASGQFVVGNVNNTHDVANVGSLSNSGSVYIGTGATLNLTSQPSGITDVVSGSTLDVAGTFKAGANSALANLNSIEGTFVVENAQSTTATPGSGTLTVSSSGILDVEGFSGATTLTISGNLTNSGFVETNRFNHGGAANLSTLTLTGTFTNNASSQFIVGNVNNTHDVANVGSLSNSGSVYIGTGATLNLTSQPSGITDVVSGSTLDVAGTFKAGANNALAHLNSIEGTFTVENGQSTTATPGSGTLTVSSSGILDVEGFSGATTLTISGNLTNSGFVETNRFNHGGAANLSTLTLTGTFTNNATGQFIVGNVGNTHDVANIGTLSNSGTVSVGDGATLNLTGATATNSGSIILGDSGGGGTLKISGSTLTLSGTGTVTLSNNSANRITGASASDILTNNSTIQGAGNIGGANMGLVNGTAGMIIANAGAGQNVLNIQPDTKNFTNNGTLSAVNGSVLDIITSSGSFTNFNGTTSTLTGGTYIANNATIEFPAGSNGILIDAANITLTGASAEIFNTTNSTNALTGLTTIASSGSFTINGGANFTTAGNFTNSGTLNVGSGSAFVVNLAHSLTNFSSNTLTGGTYIDSGTLQFANANIVTLGSGTSLTMSGTSAKIEDQTGAADGLTNFATNKGTFAINSGFNFTTGGNFTNSGTLNIGSGSAFVVNLADSLTNFNSSTHTLTGGTYVDSGTLQFANANIVTLGSGTSLTMSGATAKIEDQTSVADGLTNFATNNGTFALASGFNFTTGGNFTNSGTLNIGSGSAFVVNLADSLTNFNSSTHTLTGGIYIVGGTLQFANANIVTLGTGTSLTMSGATAKIEDQTSAADGLTNFATNNGTFALASGFNFTTAGNFTNNGTLNIGSGTKFEVNLANSLTNFSSNTLTGGTYINSGVLQFANANIVTLGSGTSLTMSGATAKIEDQTGVADGLTNFATNNGTFAIASGFNFTTAGNFTNSGTLNIGSGTKFEVNLANSLTNFSSNTLTGGTYINSGVLQFANANIVTLGSGTSLTMSGATAKIEDQTGVADGLTNFATNNGTFAIASGFNFTTAGNFTNNGTLNIGSGTKFEVNLANSLTNFSSNTLTGGTYINSGVLQFANANIVTLGSGTSLTMSGATAKIEDQTGVADGLTNFATNNGTFATASGFNFTTAGNFTNNGTLNIGSGTKFEVNLANSLTNFSSNTLTGGIYNVTGTLQFAGANIVTNAANITLTGTTSQILNQSSANGLANFATNNGSFALAGNRSFTTAGSFTNAGTFTINTGSTFTLGSSGVFTQSGGTTTDNGVLSASTGGVSLNGGSLFGTGSITGALNSSSSGTITPGDSSTLTGILKDTGTYTQNSGILDVSIAGTTAGTKFDQLNPTTATLSGTLNISLTNGFVPAIGSTFKIMNFTSETGTFATVNGLAINSGEHFTITYQPTDVLLTVVSGALSPLSTATVTSSGTATTNVKSPTLSTVTSGTTSTTVSSQTVTTPGSTGTTSTTVKSPTLSSTTGTSAKTTRTVINVSDSGQLLSLLDNAKPGPGGKITISASTISASKSTSNSGDSSRQISAASRLNADHGAVGGRHMRLVDGRRPL